MAASDAVNEGPWAPSVTTVESPRFMALRGAVRFWSRDGACESLEVTGRCPERAGEVLMLTADAETTGATLGEPLPLAGFEPVELQRLGLERPGLDEVVVVGTYDTPRTDDDWLIPSRLTKSNEQTSINGGYQPYIPAPFITTPETVEALGGWTVRVDTHLDDPGGPDPRAARRGGDRGGGRAPRHRGRGRGRHAPRRRHQLARRRRRGGALPAVDRAQLHRPGRPLARPGRAGPADAPAQRGERAPGPRARPRLAARRDRAPAVGPRPRRAAGDPR